MLQPVKFTGPFFKKERHGDYGGGTVQVIPHITNEIKSRFYRANFLMKSESLYRSWRYVR